MDSDRTTGDRLTGSVSHSDHEGYARATRTGLVASGEREASPRVGKQGPL